MHSPYTLALFTCHIPNFILLMLSCYHITPHLISPSIISYTYCHYHTSPLSSHITHHNTSHPTSQFTHHHINTMTTSADDSRNISSESSCYIYFITYLLSCFNLSNIINIYQLSQLYL